MMRYSEKLSSLGLGNVHMIEASADIPLDKLVRLLSAACDGFMQHFARVTPMYHIVCRPGFHLILDSISGDKDESVAKVRLLLKVTDAVAYAFCDEAWIAEYQPDEVKGDMMPDVPPQDRPNREEIVLIQAESEREGELTGRRKIIRDKNGKPTLGPLEIERYDESRGRMVGMLPRRGAVQ
jgi:hypothetical protein